MVWFYNIIIDKIVIGYTITKVEFKFVFKEYKTEVLNDPLSQPTVQPAV